MSGKAAAKELGFKKSQGIYSAAIHSWRAKIEADFLPASGE